VGEAKGGPLMGAVQDFATFVSDSSHWWGNRGILHRAVEHMRVSFVATGIAAAVALPPAFLLGHVKRGGLAAQSIVNIGRAVPSFALLALLFPLSLEWGFGLGFWPTVAVMILLAVPPMFTNAYVGVRDVDPSVVEASRGMGMRGLDVLLRVEMPIAAPLIITSLRLAFVQVVATATLGGLFGLNASGTYIFEGFAQQDDGKLLTGAVSVAVLAILSELMFSIIASRATPWMSKKRRELDVLPPVPAEAVL
jgi:osmoprotectant transport system permease protein